MTFDGEVQIEFWRTTAARACQAPPSILAQREAGIELEKAAEMCERLGIISNAEHERAESLLGDVAKWQTRAEAAEAELVRLRNALAGVTTLEALGALKDSDPGDAPDSGSASPESIKPA